MIWVEAQVGNDLSNGAPSPLYTYLGNQPPPFMKLLCFEDMQELRVRLASHDKGLYLMPIKEWSHDTECMGFFYRTKPDSVLYRQKASLRLCFPLYRF